jgi:putative inorganic carbon (HCO3(-)) transporter
MERLLFQLRKASPLLLFVMLAGMAVLVAFVIANMGQFAAYAILLLMGALAVAVVILMNYRAGFLMMLVYSFFFFEVGRMLPVELPLGILVELFLVLITLSIFVENSKKEIPANLWSVFKNPIGYMFLIYCLYDLLEMLNPLSHSISARVTALREIAMMAMLFFTASHIFTTFNYIKFFTKFWLLLALLAAIYGMYQEYVGVPQYAMNWLLKSPEAYNLAFIWGHLRKWSFLSDIGAFGMFMAYSGIVCAVLALGPFKLITRAILAMSSMIMIISMGYSGTRTATAMVLMGLAFYVMMTINKRLTLAFAIVATSGFLALMYGPFYSGPVMRMRSTFRGSEDASMNVRDQKRLRLQPYARTHPIGGGINTVGNIGLRYEPGHPNSGRFGTDSGYLRVAMERGWIGLFVNMAYFATAMIYGAFCYYRARSEKIKIFYAAYMAAFFAISVAHFTQDATGQKPIVIIITASFVFMTQLIKFDKTEPANNQTV